MRERSMTIQLLTPTPPSAEISIKRRESGSYTAITLYYQDTLIGHAHMKLITKNHESSLLLWNIHVDSNYRGRGFGTLLLQIVEDYARAARISKIILEAVPGAEKFYENNGYICESHSETQQDSMLKPFVKTLLS